MKFIIRHELKGRIRFHVAQPRMSCGQADRLSYYLQRIDGVSSVQVNERTGDAVVCYSGGREKLLEAVCLFDYGKVQVPEGILENSGRQLSRRYQEKLMKKIVCRMGSRLFVPYPVRAAVIGVKACGYIVRVIRSLGGKRLGVEVLDAAAVGVSILRRDFRTAGSVMFLLGIGEILEEWTHKKSVGDLARSMSLNVEQVWKKDGDEKRLTPVSEISLDDEVEVYMGNVIPFDGIVSGGEGMVNQASLTGEPLPVRRHEGSYVYAGTVLEEGSLTVRVREVSGSARFEKIAAMIEESEKLKSGMESRAEHLADRLVPYTLAGTLLVRLLTGSVTKALTVLMVDFSCALKLAVPVAVLSAIREAGQHHITVKGGKYLEAVAAADVIVFDKTGTLTEARPTVKDIVVFCGRNEDEILREAACLEEHFPHSMAKAVVEEARKRGLDHEEMHSKVDYIVAHGISSCIGGHRVIIGSHHFIFEDEKCEIPPEYQERFDRLPVEYSHLYMAVDHRLTAVICIEDPLRADAEDAVAALRASGIKKIVMMTGDSERTAAAVAAEIGVDEYYSEVLPEDKAEYIRKQREKGHIVIMAGDGINDSPALSAADAAIAVSDGAAVAREIADITISEDHLTGIVTLRKLSIALMERIRQNYRMIVGINAGLIGLGITGTVRPAVSALLHNTSTLAISMRSMKNLL